MQVKGYISHSRQNLDVLKIMADLVSRHPHMRLVEIMEKFNIIKITEDDRNTPSDVILARTHVRLHELHVKQVMGNTHAP